jgi:outer membrane protease
VEIYTETVAMREAMPSLSGVAALSLLLGSLAASAATAADYFTEQPEFSYATPDDTVRVNASIGAMYLEGNEYVFNGNSTLSHLIWQTKAPVLRGSIAVDAGAGFSVSAEGSIAAFGDSYMEDYDWLNGSPVFDNWTHRSQHPDTNLDHYWTGAAALGYDLFKDETAIIRLHGGFKYTDVQWSAYGGSYVYSVGGFRDTTGNFADGEPGITYRQQFPEIFVGVDGEERYGNIRVGGLLRGGVTLYSVATDNHWMRDRLFIDDLKVAPTFTAAADIGFALGPMAEFVIAGRYEQIFQQRGDTRVYDTTTGNLIATSADGAGADLASVQVTAGLHGRF